jgi:hypothetical protein
MLVSPRRRVAVTLSRVTPASLVPGHSQRVRAWCHEQDLEMLCAHIDALHAEVKTLHERVIANSLILGMMAAGSEPPADDADALPPGMISIAERMSDAEHRIVYDELWGNAGEPPASHPDSMTRALDPADEETFDALAREAGQPEAGGAS